MSGKQFSTIFLIYFLFVKCDANVMLSSRDSCEDSICWTAENYPRKEINQLLHHLNESLLPELFGNSNTGNSKNTNNFKGNDALSCKFCNSIIMKDVIPYVVKDSLTGNFRYVVNTEKYYQRVTIEKCSESGPSRCEENYLENYIFECKQKISTIQLLCLSENKNSFETVKVLIKSACFCTYRINY